MKKKSFIMIIMCCMFIFAGGVGLTACCSSAPTKWTVSFDSCGGSLVESIEAEDNTLISQPQDPTKTGYDFVAWFKEQSYENEFDFEVEKITSNITLYAKWEDKKITVSIDDGIKDVYTQEIVYGGKISKPTDPVRTGYDFVDWYADNSYSQVFDFNKPINEDVTIYAKWEAYFTLNPKGNGITSVTEHASNFQEIEIPDEIDGKAITLVCANAFKDIDVDKFTFGKNIQQFEKNAFTGAQIDDVYFKGYLRDWVKISFGFYAGSPLYKNSKNNVVTNLYIQHRLASGEDEYGMVSGTLEIYSDITEFNDYCFAGFYFINKVEYKNITLKKYLEIKFAGYYSNPMACATTILIGNDSLWGEVNIPIGIKKIPDYAFLHCASMTNVVLPVTVTEIGIGAFDGCSKLSSINLENVTTIGDSAFWDCQVLQNVDFSSCKTVGAQAFRSCEKLTDLTFGNNLVSIGDQAFLDCLNVVTLNLGTSVESIGEFAFARSSKINAVNIPDSVKTLGERAFEVCKGIKSVNIGSQLKEIPNNCFDGASGIKTVNLGNVEKIGESAFSGAQMESIVLPNTLKEIGDEAFYGCYLLATVDDSHVNHIDHIGEHAFKDTALLNQNGTVYIKDWLVQYDKSLDTVSLKAGTKYIAAYAFNACINLTSIVIGSEIEYVDYYAFRGCSSLSDVTIESVAAYKTVRLNRDFLDNVETLKVLKSIVDEVGFTAEIADFTRTEDGNYYIFIRE